MLIELKLTFQNCYSHYKLLSASVNFFGLSLPHSDCEPLLLRWPYQSLFWPFMAPTNLELVQSKEKLTHEPNSKEPQTATPVLSRTIHKDPWPSDENSSALANSRCWMRGFLTSLSWVTWMPFSTSSIMATATLSLTCLSFLTLFAEEIKKRWMSTIRQWVKNPTI